MKRLRLVPCVIWLCALLLGAASANSGADAPTAAAAPATANLLKNPGFEDSAPDNPWAASAWDTSQSGLPTVFFGRDSTDAHGGRYSVSVASASALYTMAHNWSQTLLVGPEVWGKDMVFSVWTKSNGVEGRAYVLIQAYQDTVSKMSRIWGIDRDVASKRLKINKIDDPLIDLGWKRQFFSEPETEWVRREVRVFVPPTVNVVFVRAGMLGTGQIMLDDASLTVEPALPAADLPLKTNLLTDPDFEGDGNAWEYSVPPYPNMRIERDSAAPHSGKTCMRLSSESGAMVAGRAGVCQVMANRNLAGKRVKLTGWVKTDSLKSTAYVKIFCHTIKGVIQESALSVFSGTMDWSPATIEMDVPKDTYELWVWFAYSAPAVGRVYFDDASLEVLGAATASRDTLPAHGQPDR